MRIAASRATELEVETKTCRELTPKTREAQDSPAPKKGLVGQHKADPPGTCTNQYLHADDAVRDCLTRAQCMRLIGAAADFR